MNGNSNLCTFSIFRAPVQESIHSELNLKMQALWSCVRFAEYRAELQTIISVIWWNIEGWGESFCLSDILQSELSDKQTMFAYLPSQHVDFLFFFLSLFLSLLLYLFIFFNLLLALFSLPASQQLLITHCLFYLNWMTICH